MSREASPKLGIEAQPIDVRRCRFVIGRPLFPERWAFFPRQYESDLENAPLAARIFGIPGVESVLIAHDKVTITRTAPPELPILGKAARVLRALAGDESATADSWRSMAKKVAAEVRAHWESGVPAILDPARIVVPSTSELSDRIEHVLETEVNPVIASHGGGVAVVGLIDNVVYLKMSGGCQGCGLADMTLKHGVEAAIRESVPEIGEIIDLTDHAGGMRPFVKTKGNARTPFAKRSP